MGRIDKRKEREELKQCMLRMFRNIMNRGQYFSERVCKKCGRFYTCHPEGYTFEPKEIEKCDKIPEILKIVYQARALDIIKMDYPLEIDLKKLGVIKGGRD